MLKKFIVERSIKHIDKVSSEQVQQIIRESNIVLTQQTAQIQWMETYLTENKLFCIYMAPSKELLKVHAESEEFPLDNITEIKNVLNPTIEKQELYKAMAIDDANQFLLT